MSNLRVPPATDPHTIGSLLTWAQSSLESSHVMNVAQEALWLMAHALGMQHHELASRKDQTVSANEQTHIESLVSRRATREPLQYILGTQEFCGLNFRVNPAVLIPRPETELLVQEALREGGFAEGAVLVDVGTGSGCVAVTVATILSGARVFALDRSADALATAKQNAHDHGVYDHITWLEGDLLAPLRAYKLMGAVDAVISNPPYIPEAMWRDLQLEVRDFEPRLALVAGPSGIEFHERLLEESKEFLVSGGLLVMELGKGQDALVRQAAVQIGGYTGLKTVKDAAGIERVLIAWRS